MSHIELNKRLCITKCPYKRHSPAHAPCNGPKTVNHCWCTLYLAKAEIYALEESRSTLGRVHISVKEEKKKKISHRH